MDERAVVLCFRLFHLVVLCLIRNVDWIKTFWATPLYYRVLQNELAAAVMVANSVYHLHIKIETHSKVGLRLELESGQEQTLRALDVVLV